MKYMINEEEKIEDYWSDDPNADLARSLGTSVGYSEWIKECPKCGIKTNLFCFSPTGKFSTSMCYSCIKRIEKSQIKKLRDKDLPLFINNVWVSQGAFNFFMNRLRGVSV